MTTTTDFKAHAASDYNKVVAELGALKKEFNEYLSSVKTEVQHDAGSAASAVRHTYDEARKSAQRNFGDLEAQAKDSMKAIGHQVEERPIASLLIAFGLGIAASKLLLR
jgi:ElaB/YqjD/DUF883 family membrane-anchored ribosome-binding protein